MARDDTKKGNFLDDVPKELLTKYIHPQNTILFPGILTATKLNEKEIETGYAQHLAQSPYIILQPVLWDIPQTQIGVLGKFLGMLEAEDENTFIIRFFGITRVRVTEITEKQGRSFATWEIMTELPLTPHIGKSDALKDLIYEFKLLFREFVSQHMDSDDAEKPWVQQIIKNISNTKPKTLSFAIDEFMNLLNHLALPRMSGVTGEPDLIQSSLAVFLSPDVQTRLILATNFLKLFEEKTERRGKRKISASSSNAPTIQELANILFNDETLTESALDGNTMPAPQEPQDALASETNAQILDLSEGVEPPSIAECRISLEKSIIGQARPIKTAIRSINIAKAGMALENLPLLVIFSCGPTGVGKTGFALALANYLWTKEKEALARARDSRILLPFTEEDIKRPPIIRIDCGTFAGEQSHGIANLTGSPVGYWGNKTTGKNAQPPILSPRNFPPNRITILLLDEIEKAFLESRDRGMALLGILLRMLDDGQFVNNWGEDVFFNKTIIIFTSNIGSKEIMQAAKKIPVGIHPGVRKETTVISDDIIAEMNQKIYLDTKAQFEKIFPPEFQTRVHRFVAFHFLTRADYRKILEMEFASAREKTHAKLGISLVLSDEARDWLLGEIRGEEGVRRLKQTIQKEIIDPISLAHNLKKLIVGKTYVVMVKQVPLKNGRKQDREDTEGKAYFIVQ